MIFLKRSPLITLLVITLFVYADIICENVLAIVVDQQSYAIAGVLLFSFLILQVFFSALQSGLSDFFGRKKSLIISLSISSISLLFAFFYAEFFLSSIILVIIALAAKGFWGNTIPIAFAAISDTQEKNLRESFALASSSYSWAFITLIAINSSFKSNFSPIIASGIILSLALLTCISIFEDSSDSTAHPPNNANLTDPPNRLTAFWKIGVKEIYLLREELKRRLTKVALFAYLLWEISMYSIIISQIDFKADSSQKITLAMMIGYILGIFILRCKPCSKIADRKILTFGYLISFFSIILYFVLFKLIPYKNSLIGMSYCLHAIGNAFLSPTILSILARNRSKHAQGKILGLVESVDTIAFLIATIFVMLYSSFGWPITSLILFSLASFSLSWFYFPIIKKLERDI